MVRRFDAADAIVEDSPKPSGLDYLFLFLTITNFGKVWYWPIDSELQIQIDKPLGAALHMLVLLAIPYVLYTCWNSVVRLSVGTIFVYLTFLLALTFASVLWSIDPLQSFITALDLLCIYFVAINTAVRFSPERLFTALFYYLFSIVIISVLLSVARVDFALMRGIHDGKWRGLFPHKNNFSEFLVMMWVPLMINRRLIRVNGLMFYGLGAIIFASYPFIKSSSGIALFIIAILAYSFFSILEKFRSLASKLFLMSCLIFVFVACFQLNMFSGVSEASVDYLGRDLTFTGRSQIWSFYFDQIAAGPLFGKGYAVYYLDDELLGQARFVLFSTIRSPHNAYLALAHGVGWLGVILYSIWVLLALRVSLKDDTSRVGRSAFTLLVCFSIFSFFEVSGAALPSIGLVTSLIFTIALQRPLLLMTRDETKSSPLATVGA